MRNKLIACVTALLLFAVMGQALGPNVNFEIKKIKTEPAPLQTSEYADVWLKVINKGSTSAEDANVTFVPSFPFKADPGQKTSWDLGKMYPMEEYRIHTQVKVDENAVHGTNHLKFRTSSDISGVSIEHKIPVQIRTDDAALVVNDIDFPEKVGPGTSEKMELRLKNLADSYLKNIDVKLGLASAEIPIATSETTRERIQKIAPGKTGKVSFRLNIDQDAENGIYKIPISLDYEDEAGNGFVSEQVTGLVVGGEPSLEVGINEKDDFFPGSKSTVTLRITNQGDGRANYVSVKIPEGNSYRVLSTREIYLGNMDSDDYQTAEFDIYAENSSDISLPVKLSYKESSHDLNNLKEVIPLKVYTQEELSRYNVKSGSSTLILAALAVLGLIGGLVYWKKR